MILKVMSTEQVRVEHYVEEVAFYVWHIGIVITVNSFDNM